MNFLHHGLTNKPENAYAYYLWLKHVKRTESRLKFIAIGLTITLAFLVGAYIGAV